MKIDEHGNPQNRERLSPKDKMLSNFKYQNFGGGGGGGSGSSSSSSSSASTATTTEIADSYNQYTTENLADSGNISGSLLSGGDLFSGIASGATVIGAGGTMKSNFGNVSIGEGALKTITGTGGNLIEAVRPYLGWLLIGFGVILAMKFLKKG